MARVIKTIRGRADYYDQSSQRVGGRVKTTSRYIGPVVPKRKRGGGAFGVVGLTVPNVVVGAVLFGLKAVRGELKTPRYRDKPQEPVSVHRSKQKANNQLRELYAKHQMDDSHPTKFRASFDRLPKEIQDEVVSSRNGIFAAHERVAREHQPAREPIKTTKELTPAMKAFADFVGRSQREQAEKSAAAKGTDPSKGAEAPAADEGEAES